MVREKNEMKEKKSQTTPDLNALQSKIDQLKEELQLSQNQYTSILNASPDGIVITDLSGHILKISPSVMKMFGFDEEKGILGKPLTHFIALKERPRVALHIARILQGQNLGLIEYIALRADKSTFDVEVNAEILQNVEGRPSQFVLIVRDITERKRVGEALRDSENRFRTLFEAHSDGILIADVKTKKFLYTNPAVQKIFGYTKEEFLNLTLADVHPKEALPHVIAEFEAQSRGEITLAADLPCVRKDGTVFYADINTSSIPLQGRLCNVGFFRDITERKEAEQKLKESEERFKQVAETAKEWIWEMDAEGLYTYSNPIVEQILGYKPEELVGKVHYYELFAPHIREDIQKDAADRAKRKEAFLKRVNPILHKNGQTVILETTGVPILDPVGHLLGYRGTDTDVTERKQAEEALSQEKTFFSNLFNAQQDTIFLFEPDTGKPIRWNKKFTKISGYTNDEIARMKAPHDFYDTEELKQALDYSAQQVKGGDGRTKLSLITKQGARIPFEYVATRFDVDGETLLLSIGRDLTERKQAEATLKERETSYVELFNTVKQAIYIQNPDGTFINVNQGALDMYGYKREDFIGKTPEFLSAPDKNDMQEVARLVDLAFHGHPQKFEFWGKRKDGAIFPKDVWVVKGRYFGEKVLITVAEDITERKQAEKEKAKFEANLQQAQKIESVGRLAGGVAHDFNNMLAVILGRTEMALELADPTLSLYEDLLEIQKAGERSADLTRQLLAFARKQTVAPQVLDLNKTVENMFQMLRRLIGEEIDLQWHPAAECWPVRMDPTQIDQILANLCVNARDAIEGIGQITIETGMVTFDANECAKQADHHPGEFVLLSVKDTGQGMDKETRKHIFEPFFTTKGIAKGTGLGLATIYGAVQQNKGFIEVSSKPGKGTTFRIYLPRHMGKIQPVQTEKIEPTIQRGEETILLVEDEPAILEITAKMLEKQGYTVLAANTPGKAIQMARENHGDIQLLITDVVMPEMNGRALAKTILSLYPEIKRLFMSGYTADVIAHQGVLDEGVCFIQKPFTQKELAEKVQQALTA